MRRFHVPVCFLVVVAVGVTSAGCGDESELVDAGGEQGGPGCVGWQVQPPGAAVLSDPAREGEQA